MKRALITGITGQDGCYLSRLLLDKGYEVHGIIRRSSLFNTGRIDDIFDRLHLHYGDMLDGSSLRNAVALSQPDEVYNLAAQSHVKVSFEQPEYTHETVALGALRLFEAVRQIAPEAKVYQAGSSEMFGNAPAPQNEQTPFQPVSPYGIAKVAAHQTACAFRDRGLWIANGILFNHESPVRGETFLTRKITRAVGRILVGLQDKVYIGNLEAKRDWGYAGDYVKAMWLMLQQDQSDDYVIATGETYSVKQWCEMVFDAENLNWMNHVVCDEAWLRPVEVNELCGDWRKAKEKLGWWPECEIANLAWLMRQHDKQLARNEAKCENVIICG